MMRLRTLPPAGPPLPFSSLIKSLKTRLENNDIENSLTKALEKYFGIPHVVSTDSGRSGLSLALLALHSLFSDKEKTQRTEVLIPAYVSYSVPSAVVHAGFKVRLYDVNPVSLSPDLSSMQKALSENTVAIVLCHQFGIVFDTEKAKEMAHAVGAFVVDDAAQAMGGMIDKEYAACMGDIGLFSLSRGKPLTAVEGGLLLTANEQIAKALFTVKEKLYGEHSQKSLTSELAPIIKSFALYVLRRPHFYSIPASMPWLNIGASIFEPDFHDGPMSPYRMALCLASLPLLENANDLRRKMATRYSELLANHPELQSFSINPKAKNIYLRYPVLPREGTESLTQKIMQDANGLRAKKLGISRGFPKALHQVDDIKPFLAKDHEEIFSGAEYLAKNLITLPCHDQVSENDFKQIMQIFSDTSKALTHTNNKNTNKDSQ